MASCYQLNTLLLYNTLLSKSLKSHSINSLSLGFTDNFVETPILGSPSAPKAHFLGQLRGLETLNSVKAIHAQTIKMSSELSLDSIEGNHLITSYLELGDFRSAVTLFIMGFTRNYLCWNNFMGELRSFGGDPSEILQGFRELYSGGVLFDDKVVTMILRLCASLQDLRLGVAIHACLMKRGFDMDVYLKRALINFYGQCWGVESADKVFGEMPEREGILWDEMIVLNLKNERWKKALELFKDMQYSFMKPKFSTIINMIQVCGNVRALNEGKEIHGYVIRRALGLDLSVCSSLIVMYSRNNKLERAKAVFDSMMDHNLSSWNSIISSSAVHGRFNDAWHLLNIMESSKVKPDIVTWNCLLSGHSLHCLYEECLAILRRMQIAGFKPNSSSITSVLQAATGLGLLNLGKEIHGFVIRNRLSDDVYVGTSLLDMYVKNNCLTRAQAVFNNMKKRNICSWNALISGYSFKGFFEDAEKLINSMVEEGIKPDIVTWNSLMAGYSKWGHTKEALCAIDRIKSSGLRPTVVSWTALISGCSQNENHRGALRFFIQMQKEGIKPNSATISSLLRICAGLSLLNKGEEIHSFSVRTGFIEDVFVATALIDMYCKAGNFRNAHKVFKKIQNKTLASWNCMIMGFAIHGYGQEAISLFHKMHDEGLEPDAITFTALLSGCRNSGLVEEGWKYFDSMSSDYNIDPTIEHYCCMVDLLGRTGYLDEAWDFIQTMPLKPDASIWGALLASCRAHKNLDFAETAANNLFKLEPYNSANYVLMMNLYSMENRWEDVERVKNLMSKAGAKKSPVWSWIQIDRAVHVFCSEGKPHSESGQVYFELYQLISEMKNLGYVPDINCVHQNTDEADKEKILLSHTEKLAITYGLMKAKIGVPIRVINNTRVCNDCHEAAKYMSLIQNREIFLRDGLRFHHIKEGKCSCNDCW